MQETLEIQETTTLLTKKEMDRTAIKSLAGNFEVSFKFAETFSPIPDYQYGERHFSNAKEIAFILEDTENKISIQHILFMGNHQIKHWRQDWIFENDEILELVKDHHWKKIKISQDLVKGTWTQNVYQVDDCPRYQGLGTWNHVDGRHFWQSTADSALPRREISTAGRKDYNILRRHSHIELYKNGGWILEQDNEKIHRDENNKETLICLEKGLERFDPIDYDATEMMAWWNDRKDFWAEVRNTWNTFIAENNEVIITEDEKLYMAQFDLAEEFCGDKFNAENARKAIYNLLSQHVDGFKM